MGTTFDVLTVLFLCSNTIVYRDRLVFRVRQSAGHHDECLHFGGFHRQSGASSTQGKVSKTLLSGLES